MFGSESRIPENVRKAMLLEDYGQGKPLTARRIMAVKQARAPSRTGSTRRRWSSSPRT
jgi:hypothetical protein